MDYASVGCCLLAFLLYYNTLEAGFVYDDRRAILSNPDLLPNTPWIQILENDFWGTPLSDSGSHGSYRPLSVLTFRLNYMLSGFQPRGYHLGNVLLHCFATALLIRVARHILPRSKSAAGSSVAGLVFATHPIHTETVAGVVGRADLAACNFYLLSFLAYVAHVRHRDNLCCEIRSKCHKYVLKMCADGCWSSGYLQSVNVCCVRNQLKVWIYIMLCLLLSLAAMLSKETGITVLGICFLYDFVYSASFKQKQWRSFMVLAMALSVILTVRLQAPTPKFSTADNPTAREPSFLSRFLTFAYLPVFNFWLLLYPNNLSFDWSMDAIPRITMLRDRRNFLTILFYVILFQMIMRCISSIQSPIRFREKRSKRRSSLCTCSVCHSTLINFQHHSVTCRNTNNNNCVSAVSCMCLVTKRDKKRLCEKLTHTKLNKSGTMLLALGFLVLPFLPATNLLFYVGFVVAERVLYLPSAGMCLMLGLAAANFWKGACHLRKSFRTSALVLLAVMLCAFALRTIGRNKDWHNEEALYRSAININPPKAYGNLGSVLSSQGRIVEAEMAYRRALLARPNMADVHYNLGILLQGKQQLDEAILSYQRAIHFRPSLALAYVNLGTALIAAGRCQEAVSVLRQGSRLDGTGLKDQREHESAKVSALLQLGALYSDQGRLQRALATYREAAHSLPDNYPPQSVFNVLGETLSKLHQDEEAERWYQAALHAQPNHVPAHITYGKLLAKNISRTAEAEQWFRKAQKLAPTDPTVYHYYGEFLASRRRHKEAAGMYEKAAKLRPTDYELVLAAATAMRQAARHHDAELWYRKAVNIKPNDAQSLTNLGAILHLNGKYKEAAECYRKALRLQPNDITTLTNLQRLQSVMT